MTRTNMDDCSIDYHTSLAASWDQRYTRGGFYRRATFFRRNVLPRLDLNGDWLDVGCGSGYFSRMLSDAGARIVGIDGSPEMIRVARALSAKSTEIFFYTLKLNNVLNLPARKFDGVICLSVLEYLENPQDCFGHLVRILKPGGQLVVSVPNENSVIRRLQQIRHVLTMKKNVQGDAYLRFSRWAVSPRELRSLHAKHGLTGIDLLSFDPVLPKIAHSIASPSLLYAIARMPMELSPEPL